MPRRNPSSSVTSQMLSGIADSLWVVAWHTYAGSRAPATPPGAYEAAQDFLDLMSDAASQTVDQMWRAVEHLLPNPRAFGEAAWEMSQGGSVRGMSNYAIPLFDVEFDGNDLTWEGQTRHAVQPKKRKGRKTARRDVARAIKAAGLSPRSAGLNADWSNSAWHLGPGGSPNQVDGDYYIVEDEDDADHFYLFQYFPVALNEGDKDEDEARVELHDGTLDSVIDAARQAMTLRNNPKSGKRARPSGAVAVSFERAAPSHVGEAFWVKTKAGSYEPVEIIGQRKRSGEWEYRAARHGDWLGVKPSPDGARHTGVDDTFYFRVLRPRGR